MTILSNIIAPTNILSETNTATVSNKTISGSSNTLSNLDAANLTSGTVPTARLGSGTANGATFLRGDNTWASAGGGWDNVVSLSSGTFSSATLKLNTYSEYYWMGQATSNTPYLVFGFYVYNHYLMARASTTFNSIAELQHPYAFVSDYPSAIDGTCSGTFCNVLRTPMEDAFKYQASLHGRNWSAGGVGGNGAQWTVYTNANYGVSNTVSSIQFANLTNVSIWGR